MAGAFSLFLGMLGFGTAGAVSAGQNAKIKKADYQYGASEVLQMRERVRKEWWSICGKTYNACERPAYLINCLEFQVSFSLAFYFISVFRYT